MCLSIFIAIVQNQDKRNVESLRTLCACTLYVFRRNHQSLGSEDSKIYSSRSLKLDLTWIQIGEELLLDYGELYWQGREDEKID